MRNEGAVCLDPGDDDRSTNTSTEVSRSQYEHSYGLHSPHNLLKVAHIEGAEEGEDDGDYVHNGGDRTHWVEHHLQLAHGAHQKRGAAKRYKRRAGLS